MALVAARVLGSLAASPSPTRSPAGAPGHGAGFVILAVLLVGAFLISTWRLRRGR